MSVRPLAARDLEALVALEGAAQQRGWSAGQLEEELMRADAEVRGLFEDERLVGYAAWRQSVDELWLLNLAVAPARRRHGYGRILVAEGGALARARGCTTLWLEVRASNEGARVLYEKLGFAVVGRRPGYYPPLTDGAPREDALQMRLASVGEGA
jgi:[ribosomal protein S18]-alanine N-acetyltransferase